MFPLPFAPFGFDVPDQTPRSQQPGPKVYDVLVNEDGQVVDIIVREETTGVPVALNYLGYVGVIKTGGITSKVLTSIGQDAVKRLALGVYKGHFVTTDPFDWDILLQDSNAISQDKKNEIYARISPLVKLFDVFDVQVSGPGVKTSGYPVITVYQSSNPNVPPLTFNTFVDP